MKITYRAITPAFDFPVTYAVMKDGIVTHLQIVEYPSGRHPVDIIDGETKEDLDIGFATVDSAIAHIADFYKEVI